MELRALLPSVIWRDKPRAHSTSEPYVIFLLSGHRTAFGPLHVTMYELSLTPTSFTSATIDTLALMASLAWGVFFTTAV